MPTCADFALPFLPWVAAMSRAAARPPRPALTAPALLAPLLGRPVAIFGGGMSGHAVRDVLARLGARGEIFDEKPGSDAARTFGRADAEQHPLVVFSRGSRRTTRGCRPPAPPAAPASANSISRRCSGRASSSRSPGPTGRRPSPSFSPMRCAAPGNGIRGGQCRFPVQPPASPAVRGRRHRGV